MTDKLIAITGIGSYYSPWFPYSLASVYFADEIIVVNGGYDPHDPRPRDYNIPLKEVGVVIRELDVRHKVTEVTGFTLADLRHKLELRTQKEINEQHLDGSKYGDQRAVCMTLAQETAVKHGATRILKFDTDQVLYEDCVKLAVWKDSLTCYQWEFEGLAFNVGDPDSPYNDSVFTYPAEEGSFYGAGCAPAIPGERTPTALVHSAHLRHAVPANYTLTSAVLILSQRIRFRLFTNEYASFPAEINARALRDALDVLIRPPLERGTHVPLPRSCTLQSREDLVDHAAGLDEVAKILRGTWK